MRILEIVPIFVILWEVGISRAQPGNYTCMVIISIFARACMSSQFTRKCSYIKGSLITGDVALVHNQVVQI